MKWMSHGKAWGKIEGLEEDRDFTGRPTESTNLDSWGIPETESPTKYNLQNLISVAIICMSLGTIPGTGQLIR